MTPFSRTYVVRWADCDVNGHMRNTAYSEYGTDTRVAFLSENGFPFERFAAGRFGPVILREALDYLREVRLGDVIAVDLAVVGLSPDGARFEFEHRIRRGEKDAARIVLAGGWLDLERRRLRTPPEDLHRAMRLAPRGEGFRALEPLAPGR